MGFILLENLDFQKILFLYGKIVFLCLCDITEALKILQWKWSLSMKAYLKMEPHLRRIKKRERRDGDEKTLQYSSENWLFGIERGSIKIEIAFILLPQKKKRSLAAYFSPLNKSVLHMFEFNHFK